MAMTRTVDRIVELLHGGGSRLYFGEAVTQLEHALQTAALADRAAAPATLVIAALLHDIGHLLHEQGEHVADEGVDARHEDVGHRWLAGHFGPAVTEPIRLHVSAKRFLCGTDPTYRDSLSPASRASLALQGGSMSRPEADEFASRPWAHDAVLLRLWDDEAKVPGLAVPDLPHYLPRLCTLMETQ